MGHVAPQRPSLLISALSYTSVDCPEPAGSHQGDRPEIKPDKSTPSGEKKGVATNTNSGVLAPCRGRETVEYGSQAVVHCRLLNDDNMHGSEFNTI